VVTEVGPDLKDQQCDDLHASSTERGMCFHVISVLEDLPKDRLDVHHITQRLLVKIISYFN